MGQTKILDYEGFASRGGAIYNPQDIWNYDIVFEADQAFVEADELLASTPGMTGIDYASKREEWAYALETFQMLDQFRKDFIEEVQEMDERFYRQVVNGPAEDLSHVSMSEISIPNRTSLQNFDPLYQTYYEKKELTFQDFIGSPDMSQQPYVEGFSDIFQYDDAEYADLTMQEKIRVLENGTVYENEFYMPEKEALLYLTEEYCLGFKQLYDGISGYDIITGEQLSQAERIEHSDQGIIYLFLNALLLYQSVRSLGAVKKLVTLVNEGKIDDVLRLNNRGYLDFRKGGNTSTKPNQVHHYATDKNKTYTQAFRDIADKYGLDLDADWNKELLPHQGRHPNAYHDFVLDEMRNIDNIANGNKDIFLELYESEIKSVIQENPDMLYSDYWKGLKE